MSIDISLLKNCVTSKCLPHERVMLSTENGTYNGYITRVDADDIEIKDFKWRKNKFYTYYLPYTGLWKITIINFTKIDDIFKNALSRNILDPLRHLIIAYHGDSGEMDDVVNQAKESVAIQNPQTITPARPQRNCAIQ